MNYILDTQQIHIKYQSQWLLLQKRCISFFYWDLYNACGWYDYFLL